MIGYRQFGRQLGLGSLAYRWIHQPRQRIDLARKFGWSLVWRSFRGEAAMRHVAKCLPPPTAGQAKGLSVPLCFLTGENFIHQTAFCAHSLSTQAGSLRGLEIYSDGSLSTATAGQILRLWPTAQIHRDTTLDDSVARALPPSKFPMLHQMRRELVLLRKLSDCMAGRSGFRVFLDSDMLFWRPPLELLERIAAATPFYMADRDGDGYTAPRTELTRRFGVTVAARANSGLVALDAGQIDWELMERACGFLRDAPGDRRLLEQTLWAVALGGQNARPLDAAAYRVVIDPPQCSEALRESTPPVLLHYAWQARLPYLAGEWQRYLAGLES